MKDRTSMIAECVVTIESHLLQWCNARLRPTMPIAVDTDLLGGGYLDSLLVMELAASLERQFGVTLENNEISPRNFRSVRALAALVASSHSRGRTVTEEAA